MSIEQPEACSRLSKGPLINLQDRYLSGIMKGRWRRNSAPLHVEMKNPTPPMAEGKKMEYDRTLSHKRTAGD